MLSCKDPKTGVMSIRTLAFTVIISESDVQIFVDDKLVKKWRYKPPREGGGFKMRNLDGGRGLRGDPDEPSPREKPDARRRGA